MSDSSVVGVLAEALAEHRGWWATDCLDYSDTDAISFQGCACRAVGVDTEEKHEAHVASVVAALPNIAVVMLPEDDGETRIHGASALDGIYDLTVGVPRDRVSHRSLNDITSVESMEHLGLALLAAARTARSAGGQA